ncbi:MAG: hypothetical protein EON60_12215 [Alphaproteobacteria bacterium]|nr:MAG: hypothetical protein EON60_12215 [Alphaproteobacteria bacterium]
MSRKLRIAACAGLLALTTTAHASLPPHLSRYNPARISLTDMILDTARRTPVTKTRPQATLRRTQAEDQLLKALAPQLIRAAILPLLSILPILIGKPPLRLDLIPNKSPSP